MRVFLCPKMGTIFIYNFFKKWKSLTFQGSQRDAIIGNKMFHARNEIISKRNFGKNMIEKNYS